MLSFEAYVTKLGGKIPPSNLFSGKVSSLDTKGYPITMPYLKQLFNGGLRHDWI